MFHRIQGLIEVCRAGSRRGSSKVGVWGWGLVWSLASAHEAAAAYYVDRMSAACSDGGPGSSAQPYCTITAAVAARGGAGTTIYVRPGTYREQVEVSASGTAVAPFVIEAVGSGVVVDGAQDFATPGQWVLHSGNVWRTTGVTWDPAQVFADGVRLNTSTVSPDMLAAGSFRYVAGDGLYANVGGGNPGTHDAKVGLRLYGFRVTGAGWVTIKGFVVTRHGDKGIYVRSAAHDVTVARNTVQLAKGFGIQAVGCNAVTIESNVVSDNRNHGIGLTAGTTGSTVQDNESSRNARVSVIAANGIYLLDAPNNVIRGNRLHHNEDSGVHIQSSSGTVSLQNVSWNNGDKGFALLYSTGVVHVGDVAWGNATDGFSVEGTSTGTQVHDCMAVNNGSVPNYSALLVDASSSGSFSANDNVFWSSTGQSVIKYNGLLYTVATFGTATGFDTRSLQADPRFVDPAGGDFRLRSGSPAIDCGNSSIPQWPPTDAAGRPRVDDPATPNAGVGAIDFADRGALEASPPAAVLSVFPTSGPAPLQVVADASASTDADGRIVSYRFDFGDGTVVQDSVAIASHVYGVGTWTAQVLITDDCGFRDSADVTIVSTPSGDHAPQVSAPPSIQGMEGSQITFPVTVSDPDGDPITSLVAILSSLPPANNATFTAGLGNTTGTFLWTPATADTGSYAVRFAAVANGLSDTAVTVINVIRRQPADEIHWTFTGPTSVTFDWRGSENAIRYGLTPQYGSVATAVTPSPLPFSSPGPFREARLTGLVEDTLYHYSIGDSPDHTFRTPRRRGMSDFTVCVEGDIGDKNDNAPMPVVQSLIAASAPDFCLLVGDLTYANAHGQAAVDQHFNDVMVWSRDAAYMPTWGNHEWDDPSNDDLRNYKGRFDLPNPQTSPGSPAVSCCGEDWYWFDYGNVRFIIFPEPFPGAFNDWAGHAEALMDEADQDTAITFIVTAGHRPAYSSGHHPGHQALRGILDGLGSRHPKYVLNLVGHSHNYERTYPMNGVTHVTVGNGGENLQLDDIGEGCRWLGGCPPPAWSAFRALHHGHLRLNFGATEIRGEAVCGPPSGAADDPEDITCSPGSAMDIFTITRHNGQVSVISDASVVGFGLAPGFPNPFDRQVTFRYTLPQDLPVYLGIYDLAGKLVAKLVDGTQAAGSHSAAWNGRTSAGYEARSGVYFLRVMAGKLRATRKLVLSR